MCHGSWRGFILGFTLSMFACTTVYIHTSSCMHNIDNRQELSIEMGALTEPMTTRGQVFNIADDKNRMNYFMPDIHWVCHFIFHSRYHRGLIKLGSS